MALIREGSNFFGFVSPGQEKYTFNLTISQDKQNSGSLNVDWRLYRSLGDSLHDFLKPNNEFSNPLDFYHRFNNFVMKNIKTPKKLNSWLEHSSKISVLLKSLINEINEVHKFIKNFDLETRFVEIEMTDSQLRIHRAVVQLSLNYKSEPISVISHDLPQVKTGIECNLNLHNIFSLSEFCDIFSKLVSNFQQFWNTIGLLDSMCCVLDPSRPSLKDVFRRIKLTDTVSVMLTFNPFCPTQRPNIKLLGSQSDVNMYQDILQNNLENDMWDDDQDLLYNLSSVLETSLPNKIFTEISEREDLSETGECAICFTYELNNEIPNEICENQVCKSIYHSTCLFTYLSSIPRNRDYFGKIQGECPNCNDVISCIVPKLMC